MAYSSEDSEFLKELEERLMTPPFPLAMSETEKKIALKDFHSGISIEGIIDHIIYGELYDPELLMI